MIKSVKERREGWKLEGSVARSQRSRRRPEILVYDIFELQA